MVEQGSILREVKLLRCFTDQELNELVGLGEAQSVEAHANVIIEGELTWGLYLLIDGMVGVHKINRLSGDSYEIGQLRKGSFFGEMSLVDENPRSATVKAQTASSLFFISKDSFKEFLDHSPERKIRFYQTCVQDLVTRLRDLDENYVISQYQLWKAAIKGEAA